MADDHEDEEAQPAEYDPTSPTPPGRAPPVRSTAPQSDYTMGQVGFGVLVLLIGLAVTFGLTFALV